MCSGATAILDPQGLPGNVESAVCLIFARRSVQFGNMPGYSFIP